MADDLSDIYSAFGGAPPAPPPPLPSGGVHDDLSDLHIAFATPTPSRLPALSASDTAADVAKSAGSGMVRGIVGAPTAPASIASLGAGGIVDGADWLVRKALGLGPASQETKDKQAAAAAHAANLAVPDITDVGNAAQQALTPYLHTPQTTLGKYAETTGEFAPLVATNPATLATMGGLKSGAKMVAGGVVAPAMGSEAAGQATEGTALEPYARLAGGILGGGAAHAAVDATAAAARSPLSIGAVSKIPGVGDTAANWLAERAAARKIAAAANDLPTFAQSLNPDQPPTPAGAASPDQPIPGFNPTTAELIPDAGIAQMQRGDRIAFAPDYLAREQEQKAAQSQAAQTLKPDGDPTAVSNMVQQHFDAIDGAADAQVQAKMGDARQQTDAIGTGDTPDAIGADLRSHLDTAAAASKEHYRQLYSIVNPDGTLAADTSGILSKADQVYGQMSPTAQAFLSPAERTFAGILDQYKPTMPFNEVVELKSELAEAMRAARATPGQARAVARMSSLMQPIQDAISGSVEARHGEEAQAVASGQMAPEDTMEAHVNALRQKWADDLPGTAFARGELASTGTDAGGFSSGRATSTVGAPRAEGASAQQSLRPPSDPGVPPQALRLPTSEDAANLRAADAAFKQHQQTFNEGPIKSVLAPGPRPGEFKTPDNAVPQQVLRAGPAGYRAAKAYLDAAGNTPEAIGSLKGAMAEVIRGKVNADGLLPSDKLGAVKNRYQHTIRAIEEASPGYAKQFDDAGTASDAALAAVRDKAQQIKDFQRGTLGKYLGASDAEGVIERVGKMISSGDDRVANTRALVDAVKHDPAALAGARNAAGEWLSRQFLSDQKTIEGDPTVTEGAFRKAFRQRAASLREILTPEQMETAGKIAETFDMQRRSTTGSRLGGTSGTTQDAAQASKQGHGHAATSMLGAIAAGAVAGGELLPHTAHGAVWGAAAGGGTYMMKTLRAAGLHTIQEVVHDALMNPDRARQLLKHVSPNDYRERRISGIVRQSFMRRR